MQRSVEPGGEDDRGSRSVVGIPAAAVRHAPPLRRLATIMVADVAGYSLLMGRDEEGTYARLVRLYVDAVRPAIERHGGKVVKNTGDGVVAEFASVVEGVRCAVEIQAAAAERNGQLPADQRIQIRIGLNLCDVIIGGGDVHGDGVNIAARLEGLAEPGGIVVSSQVRDQVHDRLPLVFEDMGERRVKNIARPTRAYRVLPAGSRAASPRRRHRLRLGLALAAAVLAAIGGGWWWLGHPTSVPEVIASWRGPAPSATAALSIVVLPFANLGGDAQQDYFVDGITESLTTDLSRALPGSFVVARGTAFTYKGKTVDARQVGRDLNVGYLLQGSVLADGDRLRVNALLIDARTGSDLWAERFDVQRKDVLEVQDQIVGRLSRAVGLQVVDFEARRAERERPANPSAIELVMRGQAVLNRPSSRQTMIQARELFQQALQHDADNVDALAGVAATYVFEVLNSYYGEGRDERLSRAELLVGRALALDPRHIVALKVRAGMLRAEGKFDEAMAASRLVLAQNPGEPWAYKELGLSALYLARPAEALDWFSRADQIGPRDPGRWIWLGAMGRAQFFLGHNDEAVRLLRLSAEANPSDPRAHALLAAIHALAGQAEEAKAELAACLRLRPDMTIKRLYDDWSVPLAATSPDYRRQHDRFREGLKLAGMPEA